MGPNPTGLTHHQKSSWTFPFKSHFVVLLFRRGNPGHCTRSPAGCDSIRWRESARVADRGRRCIYPYSTN